MDYSPHISQPAVPEITSPHPHQNNTSDTVHDKAGLYCSFTVRVTSANPYSQTAKAQYCYSTHRGLEWLRNL